jgi:hypothetical protein
MAALFALLARSGFRRGTCRPGYLLTLSTFGWPLLIGGGVKGVYDILLLIRFQKVRPPEEARATGD